MRARRKEPGEIMEFVSEKCFPPLLGLLQSTESLSLLNHAARSPFAKCLRGTAEILCACSVEADCYFISRSSQLQISAADAQIEFFILNC